MRLKMSPKEALLRLDKLVQKGEKIRSEIIVDFDLKIDEAEKAEAEESAMNPLLSMHNHTACLLAQEVYEGYEEKNSNWVRICEQELGKIFLDFVPINTFFSAYTNLERAPFAPDYSNRSEIIQSIDDKVKVLTEFYNQINQNVRSPLNYLEDKATICFYDFVCELTPNTNEAEFCKYMFDFSINQRIEMEDIFEAMTGERKENYDKNAKRKVENALDGINRKTKKAFGFPILKKERALVALTLPTRFISGIG